MWVCEVCTLIHDEVSQADYLSCSACGSPRSSGDSSSSSSSSSGGSRLAVEETEDDDDERSRNRKRQKTRDLFSVLAANSQTAFSVARLRRRRRRRGGGEPFHLIAEAELCRHVPMTLVRDVLSPELADELLLELERDSQQWDRPMIEMFGKHHASPRQTASYDLAATATATATAHLAADDTGGERRAASRLMKFAAQRVAEEVNRLRPSSEDRWEPTFVFCNRYADGNDSVSLHADALNELGPRPIIVGLALGAQRDFLMQEQLQQDSSEDEASCGTEVRVRQPHASIIVMWDDAQENYKHAVPKCPASSISRHAVLGDARISLTFRMARIDLPPMPNCDCGRRAWLKASSGRYYYACSPYGHRPGESGCDFWQRCGWADEEATARRRKEKKVAAASDRPTTTAP